MREDIAYVYRALNIVGKVVQDKNWIYVQFGNSDFQWLILPLDVSHVSYYFYRDILELIPYIDARINS